MKNWIFLLAVSMVGTVFGQTKSEEKSIEKAVKAFIRAGDAQDVAALSSTLHTSYRLTWYGGKDAPFIADREIFLEQFKKKEWGGDTRVVTIERVELFDGVNAVAKVVSDGKQAQMRSLFSLIKVDGEWKIIAELVNATFKG